MAKPVIFWDSILRTDPSTLVASSSALGFPVGNLKDYRSYTVWKSDTTASPIDIDLDLGAGPYPANYLMLVNHNLSTIGATVELRNGAAFPPATSVVSFAPTENTVSYRRFTLTPARQYWRLHLTGAFASAPFIGELFVGTELAFSQFMAPTFDPFFKNVEVMGGARSRGGHYLGASLRGQTHRGEITFGEAGLSRAALTTDLLGFIEGYAYLRLPFGFVLDYADTDFAVCRYLKVPDDAEISRRAVGGSWQQLTLVIPVEEAFMEPAV